MQTDGWKQGTLFTSDTLENLDDVVYDEPTSYAGTMGRSLRMEALEINFKAENATLKYRAHVQTDGWQEWVTADSVSDHEGYVGTVGASKRMEAVQISVEGLEGYKLLYRAHVQGIGWQDWMDAENPDEFAGTTGESKRIEALEIALIPVSDITYTPAGNGKHIVSYKGTTIGESKDCVYGDWETNGVEGATAKQTMCRKCSLCNGNAEYGTLKDLLKASLEEGGDGVVKLQDLELKEKLTVEAENTLIIEGDLSDPTGEPNNEKITNKGTIIINGTISKTFTDNNLVNSGEGKVIWNHKFTSANEFEESAVNSGAVKKFLSEVKLADGSKSQTLSNKFDVNNPLTLDLNGGKLTSKVTTSGSSTYGTASINNKSNLTIKNGTLDATVKESQGTKNYVVRSDESKSNLILENVKVSGYAGISTNGKLSMVGGSIASTEGVALQVSGNKNTAALEDVTITSADSGICTYGTSETVNLTNVTVSAQNFCLHTYGAQENTKNSFIVDGGNYTSKNTVVAYLVASGNNVFTDCTLTGKEGIEVTGGTLTVEGCTINATGSGIATLTDGYSTDGGHGILLRVDQGYSKKEKALDLSVTNSNIKSTNSTGILVMQKGTPTVKTVNINLDNASKITAKGDPYKIDSSVNSTVKVNLNVAK